jgi:hypothetical protein
MITKHAHRAAGTEMMGGGGVRRIGLWIGGLAGVLTATLGIAFNLDSLGNLLSDRAQQRSAYAELLATSQQQVIEGTYELAWTGLEKALSLRTSTAWKLRGMTSFEDVQLRQADLAMVWLRNIRLVGEKTTFTSVVERVQPALQREEVRAGGARKADVVAHLGYAEFLRSRDGQGGLDPEARYREALSLDRSNPFANAMLAHWRLWTGGSVAEAEELFKVALAAQRERAYVRQLQLAAFGNRESGETDVAFLRTLRDMVQGGEKIGEQARSAASAIYYFHSRGSEIEEILHAMPPAEQLALVRELGAKEGDEDKRTRYDYFAALLEEAAGDSFSARTHLVALRAHLPAGHSYRKGIDIALRRLGTHVGAETAER